MYRQALHNTDEPAGGTWSPSDRVHAGSSGEATTHGRYRAGYWPVGHTHRPHLGAYRSLAAPCPPRSERGRWPASPKASQTAPQSTRSIDTGPSAQGLAASGSDCDACTLGIRGGRKRRLRRLASHRLAGQRSRSPARGAGRCLAKHSTVQPTTQGGSL